jgi:hypothetical protein
MDIVQLFGTSSVPLVVAGSVLAVFELGERLVSQRAKDALSKWLVSFDVQRAKALPDGTQELFATIFGERHFSMKCFVRSAMILALFVTRALLRSEKLVNWLRWALDVEKSPFRSIGAVAAALSFVASVVIILVSVGVSRISTALSASISVAIVGLIWFNTYVSAEPRKDLYELQERCGKRAAEVFKQEYSPPVLNTKDGQTRFNYENHYSARLNRCFFLEVAVSYDKEQSSSSKIMRLFDLNGNTEYGTFVSGPTESTPLACVVRGKGCQSESEWRKLVKPFMED